MNVNVYVKINGPSNVTSNNFISNHYSSSVRYENDVVMILGDDCIAINSGTSNIRVSGIDCGPGHGIRFDQLMSY